MEGDSDMFTTHAFYEKNSNWNLLEFPFRKSSSDCYKHQSRQGLCLPVGEVSLCNDSVTS